MAAFVAVFLGLGVYQLYQSYAEAENNTRLEAQSGARVVAANVEWVVETARQVLRRVDDSIDDPEDALPSDAASKLTEAVASIPGKPKVYVVDAAGQTLLTTDSEYKSANITDREYFLKAKAGEPYWVSSLLVSRQNGEQIFTISKRMERNGQFAGVAILSFTSSLLERVWSSLALDSLSTVGLFRDDGWLVSRFPLPNGPQDLSKYVLFTDYLPKSPEGTYLATSPTDGVSRLVAYQRVQGTNLIALSSMALEPAMARFRSQIVGRLAIGLPVVLLLFVIVGWVARLLRREDRQKRALAEAVERNNLLLREIHHRVKNHLTGVIGLINVSTIIPEEKKSLNERIGAMVSAYTSTYEHGDHFDGLDASEYIPRIVDDLAKGYGGNVEVAYDLDRLIVDGNKAMALALVVNEVVTNAFKYAFKPDKPGRLAISLKAKDDKAVLTIRDNGDGYDIATARKGTGSRLVRGFAAQLEGEIEVVRDGGTVFVLTFRPLVSADSDADAAPAS